ncbi:MAG: N-acetyl-gamma-glutamyl-phosphate reductase [Planctomycetes bacterium]|nr:N-acetyl-gamma-glutamyl-phosphate reductase [Planctomycetota bacterium]
MVRVKLIGAGGYGGIGLIEMLLGHPEAEIVGLVNPHGAGGKVSEIWPYLEGYCDMPLIDPESDEAKGIDSDVTFCATPDGVGQYWGPIEVAAGRRFVDYSGDYRFNSTELYSQYATRINKDPVHKAPELLGECVYGLTEFHREEIAKAKIVGNPGCFAMSCTIGLAPAIKYGLVEEGSVICDCKTGISGAGKKPSPGFHYPERYDTANAYRLTGHQHVMEIEHELSLIGGKDVKITFTPQVVPMTRGIMSCLYGKLPEGVGHGRVLEAYKEMYVGERFVMVKDFTEAASTGDVRGSNRVLITVACDERTGIFRVISHIDNLVKGQAGSALQNMNVMFGLREDMGLDRPGAHP